MGKADIDTLIEKKVKLHQIDQHTASQQEATELRRALIERLTGKSLSHLGLRSFDDDPVVKKNVENLIGAVSIPVGITAPLMMRGQFAQGEFYVPLATTEKSLVASTSRGCRALTLSGGVKAKVLKDRMTRAPLFVVQSLEQAIGVAEWIENHHEVLQQKIDECSSHTRLESARSWIIGLNLFVRFEFSTGDAMGMNMTTKAADVMGRYLVEQFPGLRFVTVSSNICVDKKPSALNFIEGRGKTVVAECLLPASIVREVLKTTIEGMAEVNYRKNLIGSAQAGSYGFNAHFANLVAATFIATGQDPAQVVSGSMGFTLLEKVGDSLHASVTMPSLEVATVGGGTRLPSQQDALRLLGVEGAGEPSGSNACKLAEIIAGVVLAGELSLIAAQVEHSLAKAHSIT
ncbi:hydroxymethylglutaryl-CoA reductase (NADPH) [Candidatus Wirthbacteria bacterium CG2_30_54_11]|uniref:3-hydroxy-3-methylglutaryl coenzyme A reductase n=1 Tax=Candidatus Wirthbacteria bacterium CG2_30_54_11 TaxID=1817892 RepID=A0A1J5J4G1_9BACT|nr:MAG: hydroxymethylglutaryl-CoA reductase (NADPH) [Candidatus Wirthbacteria bacterium CG2_30_54_11]